MGFQLPNAPSFAFLANVNPVQNALNAATQMQQMHQRSLQDQAQQIQNQYLQPQLAAKALGMHLANSASQARLPYVGGLAQAQEQQAQARVPYIQSQTALEQYKSKHPELFSKYQNQQIVATKNGFVRINKMTGQMQPVLDDNGNPVMPKQRSGITITNPDGTITQIGGDGAQVGASQPQQQAAPSLGSALGQQPVQQVTSNQQVAPGVMAQSSAPQGGINYSSLSNHLNGSEQQDAQSQSAGNVVQSPLSSSSNRSGGGRIYQDVGTGKAVQIATKPTTGKFQQAIAGETILDPLLKQIFDYASPHLGLGHFAERELGKLDPTASQAKYYTAMNTLIPQVGDVLTKTYGLNPTTESFKTMVASVKPKPWDTRSSYARRVASTVANGIIRSNAYKKYLKGGISLDPSNANDIKNLNEAFSDKIYNEYMGQSNQKSAPSMVSIIDTKTGNTESGITADQANQLMKKYPNRFRMGK